MSHHRCDQLFYIPPRLKACLIMSACAVVGTGWGGLQAQDKPAPMPGYPLQHGNLLVGSPVAPEDQGPPGVTLIAGQNDPSIALGAHLSGSFVDLKTNTVVNENLTVNEAANRSLIKGETYHLSAAVLSVGKPFYGLTIGGINQRSAGKEDNPVTIRVALSKPAKLIHIESDIEAEDWLASGESWKVDTALVPLQSRAIAKMEVTQGNSRLRGTISGDFADLSDAADPKAPYVTKTLDLFKLDDSNVGFIGGDYELTTTFTTPNGKPKIAFAALGASGVISQPLLMVDVDVPQKWLMLQGPISGEKFPKTGLGWGVRDRPYFKAPDLSHLIP